MDQAIDSALSGRSAAGAWRRKICRWAVILGVCMLVLQTVTLLMVAGVLTTNSSNSGRKADGMEDEEEVRDQGPGAASKISITKDYFGKTQDGEAVHRYTLSNANGVSVELITLGAIITSLRVPGRGGTKDIIQGYTNLKDYESNPYYFGALIGRYANRVANARFTLDGATYQLEQNELPHHLHGGQRGWHKYVWEAKHGVDHVVMSRTSPDGEEKYPGEVKVKVTFTLTKDNQVRIDYSASVSGKATPINLTHHPYFNLAGEDQSSIEDQIIRIQADHYLEYDSHLIPTGVLLDVSGTAFDLRQDTRIGDVIHRVNLTAEQDGYGHTFCLRGPTGLNFAASVSHPPSGRVMEIYTNQPSIQFYTSSYLNTTGKHTYPRQSSLCLETQNYPDAVNHPNFPDSILRPGATYIHACIFKFSFPSGA